MYLSLFHNKSVCIDHTPTLETNFANAAVIVLHFHYFRAIFTQQNGKANGRRPTRPSACFQRTKALKEADYFIHF
ncbi:MAG: hypothetical protein ACI96W_000342 [Paraglaciecola sp.]